MIDTLKFTKIRKVKSPARANKFDAGIDFFIPEDLSPVEFESIQSKTSSPCFGFTVPEYSDTIDEISIAPNETVLIPSGIKVNVPEGYALIFNNKSGVASKLGLIVGASVVDCGYQGEVFINLYNVSNKTQKIRAGQKIIQGIVLPVVCCNVVECSSESELYGDVVSERGSGGFGSTGS